MRRAPRRSEVLVGLLVMLWSATGAWAQPAFTTSRSTGITYTSIANTGTSFTFNNNGTDDNTSTAVTLPSGFAFSYLGTPVTGFVACLNGWISLDPTVTSDEYTNNMGGTAIPKMLAPMWEDLVCQGNNNTVASLAASMKYLISGTAPNRVLTVEWIGMEVYSNDGPNLNFQVKLFETTNVIQYQYGIMSGFDGRRNYSYTYSLGLNGSTPASSYLAQQTANSNYFAQANATTNNTGANGLAIVPASYSQVQFAPASALSTGANPSAVVPANNETSGAITLSVGAFSPTTFATTYSSANATASSGITACSVTTPGTPDDDVWFKFTLSSARNTTVTLRGSGGYDGVLQVFSNAGTTALGCQNATGAGLTETYTNASLPAGTYYVRVYEAGTGSGSTGQFALAVYAAPPVPANNECTGAVALTAASTCTPVAGTTLSATASSGIAACSATTPGTPDDDVWYSFTTAATARSYTLTLAGSVDFDGVLQVLSGSCGSLTPVSCTNATLDGGTETVTLSNLTASTLHYVRVYHAGTGSGSGDFTLCLTEEPPRIVSFSPTSGPAGTSVALTGTGLLGATQVSFNGTAQTTITSNTATSLTVAVPAGATTGTLTVTTAVGTSPASSQSFTVCAAPVAVAQNVTLPLASSGNVTLTAAAVNNGSTANCGPAVAGTLSLRKWSTAVLSGEVAENGSLTLTAPNGGRFVSVDFASYGTPTGSNGAYAIGGCHAANSLSVVQTALLGNNSATLTAANSTFSDPCRGTVKKLAVRATYAYPDNAVTAATPLTYSCAEVGLHYVTLLVTDAGNNVSTAPAQITVTVPATPTTTWSGSASTSWTDCANWSYGKVPDAATNAVIPAGLSTYPSLGAGTVRVKDLTLVGNVALNSGTIVEINGNLTHNSASTVGGTLAFVGGATQTVSGTGAGSLTNLSVNKTAGTVELQRNLTLDGTLTFATDASNVGILNTGTAYRLTLGSSATLSETEASYLLGQVAVTRTLAAGTAQSFGNIGLTLTPASGSAAPGATPVVRTTGTALAGMSGSTSILRSFDIQPTNRTGLNVNMVFSYFEHELNSIPEARLLLFKSETGATNSWQNQNPIALNTTANTVTKTGITSFSIWTLGDADRPLPVELTAFTATAEGSQAVHLAWATASEKNSAYFAVERSPDAVTFKEIGTVAAAGTSTTARRYALLDRQLPAGRPVLYYRLRQIDQDGTASYSPVQVVTFAPVAHLTLAPNPTHGTSTLTGAKAGAEVQVFDAVGRLVLTATADAAGTAQLTLPAGLPTGLYVVRAGQQTARLVLE